MRIDTQAKHFTKKTMNCISREETPSNFVASRYQPLLCERSLGRKDKPTPAYESTAALPYHKDVSEILRRCS